MREPIIIDLNHAPTRPINAGRRREENATTLIITPTAELTPGEASGVAYCRVLFEVDGIVHRTTALRNPPFSIPLWLALTSTECITVNVAGYAADGSRTVMSQVITLVFGESVDGESNVTIPLHTHESYLNVHALPTLITDDVKIVVVEKGGCEALSETIVNSYVTVDATPVPIKIRPIVNFQNAGEGGFLITDTTDSSTYQVGFTDNGLSTLGVPCKTMIITPTSDESHQYIYVDRDINVNAGDLENPVYVELKKEWNLLTIDENGAATEPIDYADVPSFDQAKVSWATGNGSNSASVYEFLSTTDWTYYPVLYYSANGDWYNADVRSVKLSDVSISSLPTIYATYILKYAESLTATENSYNTLIKAMIDAGYIPDIWSNSAISTLNTTSENSSGINTVPTGTENSKEAIEAIIASRILEVLINLNSADAEVSFISSSYNTDTHGYVGKFAIHNTAEDTTVVDNYFRTFTVFFTGGN